ncbi:MAG: hypothetical protein ACTSPD_10375 [Promethearchaeota archaeon]
MNDKLDKRFQEKYTILSIIFMVTFFIGFLLGCHIMTIVLGL